MRKLLDIFALSALLGIWGWTIYAVRGPHPLPAVIPTHFDAAGRANGWGSPAMLWLLPSVAVFIYILMSVVARFPAYFNYPVRVSAQNRVALEDLALGMISWLKVETVFLFCWIQATTIRFARDGSGGLTLLFLPIVILSSFGTIAWYIAAMIRTTSEKP